MPINADDRPLPESPPVPSPTNEEPPPETTDIRPHDSQKAWFRIGFCFALGVAALAVLGYVALQVLGATIAVAAPFVAGLILAILLDPIADKLERRGFSRVGAVAIVFSVFFLILLAAAVNLIPALVAQAKDLADKAPQYLASAQGSIDAYLKTHHKIGFFKLPKNSNALNAQVTARVTDTLQRSVGGFNGIKDTVVGGVSTIVEMVVALIVTFYLLIDIDRFRARVFFLMPERGRGRLAQIGGDIGKVFSDYLRGLLIVCALYGVCTIGLLYGLSLFEHELAQYALLVGVAAGVLYAIPYAGALTTAVVTFFVASAAGGLGFGGWAVVATIGLNQIFDNYVTPRVVGGGVGLNPVVALFALTLGGALFGFWGLLFAVPIAASIQVILFRFFPVLTEPTPDAFLRAQGVRVKDRESSKIMADAPQETKDQQARNRDDEERKKQEFADRG